MHVDLRGSGTDLLDEVIGGVHDLDAVSYAETSRPSPGVELASGVGFQ